MKADNRRPNPQSLLAEAELDLAAVLQHIGQQAYPDGSPRQLEHLSLLLEVSQRLSRVLNLEQLLNVIMDSVLGLTRAERGFLMLFEEGTLKFKVIRNPGSQGWVGDDYRISQTITQQVLRTSQPLWLKDASEDEAYSQAASIAELKLRSCMCVPLLGGPAESRKIIGVIYVDSRQIHESFASQDLDLLVALAAQAAISIENAQLVEDIRRLEEEKRRRLEEENVSLQKQLEDRGELLGQCPAMEQVFTMVRRVSLSDVSVLLLGESGTGKGLAARAIHQLSSRKDRPFVVIDCGAIPENLLESELFGYEKGAFTGAYSRKAGKFELATGGTIFLDEVGELPSALQVKLLRVLQEGVIERIGGHEPIKVDVRVIAATNRNLAQDVNSQRFRQDLFYRLNVITVHLPPLSERGGDILMLASVFLERFALKHKKRISGFNSESKLALINHPWPGNVRELEHKIERAVIMCDEKHIRPEHLELLSAPSLLSMPGNLRQARLGIERQMLEGALAQSGGDITAAARNMGISRQQVYRLVKRHGIDPETFNQK